jgi:hypothetical protein
MESVEREFLHPSWTKKSANCRRGALRKIDQEFDPTDLIENMENVPSSEFSIGSATNHFNLTGLPARGSSEAGELIATLDAE